MRAEGGRSEGGRGRLNRGMGWGNERESKQICLNLRNLRICERAGAVAVLGWAADSILKQSNYQWASNEKK